MLKVDLSLENSNEISWDLSKYLELFTAHVEVVEDCGVYFWIILYSLQFVSENHKRNGTYPAPPTPRGPKIKLKSNFDKDNLIAVHKKEVAEHKY